MAKINVAKNISENELNDLILNISNFSNSQTRVSPVDRSSNSPLLVKIKALSESIVTPSGRKWFFEKSRGDFSTKLKIAGRSGKNRIEKEYPRQFRFTKEQLGKYYSSWGNEPYKVKKGGEAIFRKFLEEVSLDDKTKKINIDRTWYELLISKIILFNALEEIHGTRGNAIGQLRSAVVPYTLAILFSRTEGDRKNTNTFDLARLWAKEKLEDDLIAYLKDLMTLINGLIKKYSKSDDLGEYSKKKELWDDISTSKEINTFFELSNSLYVFNKYSISKKELENKLKSNQKNKEVDFKFIQDSVNIHSKTPEFYKKINLLLWEDLSNLEKSYISNIAGLVQQKKALTIDLIYFESNLVQKIRTTYPDVLNNIIVEENTILVNILNFIIEKYNFCIENNEDISSSFGQISSLAKAKGLKYDSIFNEISKKLKVGEAPGITDIYYASHYLER